MPETWGMLVAKSLAMEVPIMAIRWILCAILLAWFAGLQAAVSVRSDSWPPYNGDGDPASDKPGYGIEILKAIYGEVDYQTMPWKRAVLMCEAGDFDAVISAFKEDAPALLFPKLPFGMSSTVLVAKAGSGLSGSWQALLEGRKLGTIDGYAYQEELDAWIASHPDQVFVAKGDNALEKLLRMQQAGRVDLIVDDGAVIKSVSSTIGLAEVVEVVAKVGEPGELFVAFSPAKEGSQALADQFDAGLQQLRASGALAAILARYGLSDWKVESK
jgi:polar amino acid transport system substrate-binding protein